MSNTLQQITSDSDRIRKIVLADGDALPGCAIVLAWPAMIFVGALLASPDGNSFLVGWTGTSAGPGSAMFVRRFDCVHPT